MKIQKNTKFFFIGLGGAGMSSLAHILIDLECVVHGTDQNKKTPVIDQLLTRRVQFFENVDDLNSETYDYCIYSTAIKQENNFYRYFSIHSIPLIHRSKLLHTIFSQKKSIAVTGTHGKTSTTTMVAQILLENDKIPTIMIGGETSFLNARGGCWGSGEWGVYESDESDGSFLSHNPEIKIVTNIDDDHLDFYKTKENLINSFLKFIDTNDTSISILNEDDSGIQKLLNQMKNTDFIHTFSEGKSKNPNFETIVFSIQNSALIFQKGDRMYELKLPIPGKHYLKNALSAILACYFAGVPIENSIRVLKNYKGVQRRLEYLGNYKSICVYDDYGHHPTEIKTVIESLQELKMQKDNSRVMVIFQPHRYTRTQDLYDRFADALDLADFVFLLPIYSASELEIEGVSSELIYNTVKNKEKFSLLSGKIEDDIKFIKSKIRDNDYLLSLGAGNVRDWSLEILKEENTNVPNPI